MITTTPDNAAKFADWLATRGGLAVWKSQYLGNPGASWTTPATHADGTPATAPHWSTGKTPDEIVTDAADVAVETTKEIRRFRVGLKRGNGFQIELTPAASRRVRAAIDKAKQTAGLKEVWHEFDYTTQEAVIVTVGKSISLAEYLDQCKTNPKT